MSDYSKPSAEGRRAEKALQKAVSRVVEENRRLGFPIAVMRNGKAVLIPADQAQQVVRDPPAVYRVGKRQRKKTKK